MEKLISCCGLDCATCDARIATMANDDMLREQTAEKWRGQFNAVNITAEMINCTGCREEGAKFSHCNDCEIRKCVQVKGYQTCADCDIMETCTIVGPVFQYVPDAKANLISLR